MWLFNASMNMSWEKATCINENTKPIIHSLFFMMERTEHNQSYSFILLIKRSQLSFVAFCILNVTYNIMYVSRALICWLEFTVSVPFSFFDNLVLEPFVVPAWQLKIRTKKGRFSVFRTVLAALQNFVILLFLQIFSAFRFELLEEKGYLMSYLEVYAKFQPC
jgi:hypothetical protein